MRRCDRMGSWNGTCGLSQLPIVNGDKVALFILRQNEYCRDLGGGFSYSDELWRPICPPVFGNYSDYGLIDKIKDSNNTILSYMKSEHVDINNKELVLNDLDKFLKHIERNEVPKFGFMMVHMGLYEEVTENIKKDTRFYSNGHRLGCYVEGDIIKLLDYMKSNNIDTFDNSFTTHEILSNKFKQITDRYLRYFRNYRLYEDNPRLLSEMLDFLMFKEAMEVSRKTWMPQAGSGSQDAEFEIAEIIGKFAGSKKATFYED